MATNFAFNVLATAQTVIRKQSFILRRFTGRTKMPNGVYVSAYGPDVPLTGSIQPISRSAYEKMGLDFEKSYIKILGVDEVEDLARDRSGDVVVVDGQLYEPTGKTDWIRSAGWNRLIWVRVGAA